MEKMRIEISEDLCNYIESLHYETNALQDLLARMSGSKDHELNNYWMDKYVEKYTEYSVAKQQLEKEYVIPKYGTNVYWTLIFDTCEVEVEEKK